MMPLGNRFAGRFGDRHPSGGGCDDALVRAVRRVLAVACLVVGGGLAAAPAEAQELSGSILEIRIEGVVDPFVADYVDHAISDAAGEGAAAVLLTIDTPGGLLSSMREITQAILNSRVPVIGYVSPEGARAASAGTFILLACPVAAMAPATNVGAAQPVGLDGAIASDKAVNDAAESIVAIADRQGRNGDWAERAVRDAISASAEEALELDVIDLIAPDVPTLLADVDGTTVTVAGGEDVTLDLANATIRERGLGLFVGFLHALLDPNLAFLFFWLGLALIAIEFFVPGGIAGTTGGLMLVASLVALGMLPVQLIGVALLLASVGFFVLEVLHPGVGVPALAGIVTLMLGGWFLFDSSVPDVRVSPLVIVPTAAFATFFFLVVVRSALKLRRRRAITRDQVMAGREGTVVRDLDPVGVVQVAAEEWTAEAIRGTPRRGERVRVVSMEGLRLKVEPAEEPAPRAAEPAEGRTT
jgi:membrane-bound serine protease (ClpP class)